MTVACGSAAGTVSPSGSTGATRTAGAAATGTASGSATVTPGPSVKPTGTPTEAPSTAAGATPTPGAVAASDCTGTAANRTFYGSTAAAVHWTVYCPVLPSGWYVDGGLYRLAGGGRLVITYRGPAGARFTLDEGAWCTDAAGCLPSGTDAGQTAFGDRQGTLIVMDGGSFAIAVDAGHSISWQLAGDGLDEATVRAFGAALIAVGG